MNKLKLFFVLVVLFSLALRLNSATITWTASSPGNWNTGSNWSGGIVPGSSDIAVFNSSGSANCTIDVNVNVAGIDMQSSYAGTISQGAYTITVGTSNALFSGGTFTGGSSTITINGTFTLSGTSFTSTSSTLTFNSTVTYSSGTFTHNSGTISFAGTGSQSIPAWNFNNLTFASSGARILASSGTIGISGTFTKGTNSVTNTGSTINYNGTGAQNVIAFNYNNLTFSGSRNGNITLSSSGIIGIAGTFVNSVSFTSGGFVNTTSTISYNGTSGQSIIDFNYYHLTIGGARTSNSVTLSNTGIIKVAGTLTNSATFTTGGFINTSSTVEFNGSFAQTIGAINYNNLTFSGLHAGNITLASSGVIGIAGVFTNNATFSSGGFINTSSTINYNGTGAQTIIGFDYFNLFISGARGSNNITLSSSGTIKVAKLFYNFSSFTSGSIINTSSTVEFNGTLPQVIPGIAYNNLTSSSTGSRSFGSTGIVKVAGTFTPGTNVYKNVGINGEGYLPQSSGVGASLLGSAAINSTTVFMSGVGGVIIKTTNSGTSWASQVSNTSNDLYSIVFVDANIGIAVGNAGTIRRTTDGGSTWVTVTSGTVQNLRSANFISSTVGFVTGANGVILKTNDAGATWSAMTSGSSQTLYSTSFPSASVGYAIGFSGTILKTTNSGTTWSVLSSGTSEAFASVCFINAATGIAVGSNGKILRTTDAGVTWSNISSGTSDNLSGIGFVDSNKGYIVGGNIANNTGTILETKDGGLTWNVVNPGTTRLYGIDFVDNSIGFITGLDGTILKYTCCTNGSTIEFNGTAQQTIPAMNYNNLSISGLHTGTDVILSPGVISIDGNFNPTATFGGSHSGYISTGNTVELSGNKAQNIGSFTFNNLSSNGTGSKTAMGNLTVNGTANLINGELALVGNTMIMSASTSSAIIRAQGYISTTGSGKLKRWTNSTSSYLFPMGFKTINDSADYFVVSLTPGKTSSQQFETSLHSENTGIVITHNKTLHGSIASTVLVSVSTRSYTTLQLEYDINPSADINAVRVMDLSDNTLKTLPSSFYSITGGNTLSIPNIYQLCLIYSKSVLNFDMNWVYEVDYDGNGLPISEKAEYKDLLGRTTQVMSRDVVTNKVIVSQELYDSYGRGVLHTLPAPIGSVMAFQANFINNSAGVPYSNKDFDMISTTAQLPGEINNPVPIQANVSGTLGWYYSDNNTLDPFQATTSFPYVRKEMTGGLRRASAGDEYRMGSGHEMKEFNMISGNELKFIFGINKSYKSSINSSNKLENSALTVSGGILASKQINIDSDGKEVITYSFNGLPIANCYSGLSGSCSMTSVSHVISYSGTGSIDIHLPAANKNSLELNLPEYYDGGRQTMSASDATFKITDLSTNALLIEGTNYTVNSGSRLVTFLGTYATGSSFFRISFSVSTTKLTYFNANNITEIDADINYDLDYSKWSVNYYDLAGRLRKSVSPKDISCGNPVIISAASTYDYNSLGQLISSNSPDEGKKEIVYNSEGKPRFTQTAEQKLSEKFSYINYDLFGRSIETGEYTNSNNTSSVRFQNYYNVPSSVLWSGNVLSNTIIDNTGNTGLRSADCNDKNNIYYYPLDPSEDISSSYSYKSGYTQKNLMGHVSKTKNAQSATWYSYDQAGRMIFTVQQMLDADYITHNTTLNQQIKTLNYTYNSANGTLTNQVYQSNEVSEKLTHSFYYDAALRLTSVDLTIGSGSPITQAKYYYTPTGALKRKELGDKLQGIDYIYTINGQLKSINHPSCYETKDPGLDGNALSSHSAFGKDVFGLALDYHVDDYTRSGTYVQSAPPGEAGFYNGLVSSVRNRTRAITNGVNNGADWIDYLGANDEQVLSGSTDELMTQYSYDEQNRLSIATWGNFNSSLETFTARTDYKEFGTSGDGGINYDANGNITSLKRNAYSGSLNLLMDDFSYSYTSNTNQLSSIIDAAANNYTNDIHATTSKAFGYNANGQMVSSAAESITAITYFNTGLTKKVTFTNGNTAEYWYDDRGKKIKTKYLDVAPTPDKAKFTWYVNDASGNPIAVYEYDEAVTTPAFALVGQMIYGVGRLGVIDRANSNLIEYEITDHLGNVRATIKGISQGVYQLTTRTDYYSFGGAMPGRTYNLNSYRYNYQGQENAVNSNWQQFELRMHNSNLGRWMSPDPMGQFYSPYISMGNNPVSGVDPDGGWMLWSGQGRQQRLDYRWSWTSHGTMNMGVNPFEDPYFGYGSTGGGGGSGDLLDCGNLLGGIAANTQSLDVDAPQTRTEARAEASFNKFLNGSYDVVEYATLEDYLNKENGTFKGNYATIGEAATAAGLTGDVIISTDAAIAFGGSGNSPYHFIGSSGFAMKESPAGFLYLNTYFYSFGTRPLVGRPLVPGPYDNSIDNSAYHLENIDTSLDGMYGEHQAPAIIKLGVSFLPQVSIYNGVQTIFTGTDIYKVQQSGFLERYLLPLFNVVDPFIPDSYIKTGIGVLEKGYSFWNDL